MTRFLTRCRSLFTPRHKHIAQPAINTANEAIASLDRANATINEATASLNRMTAELERTREELRVYHKVALNLRLRVEALQRRAGEDAEEA